MRTRKQYTFTENMEPAPSPEIITDPVHETTCLKCHHLMDVSGLPAFLHIACPECGSQQSVPAKMGPFLLVDLLGKGGMGAVYRGRDTGLDRWVAVKVMQSSFGGNPEFVETFRREAQAAAALNHPNIVQIYSFGVSHGQPYMVMELLEGGRMDQMIARGEPLNEALVLTMCAEVAEGLNAASAINLIHGDVKPENILLDANGIAKIVDFGLARFKEKSEGGTAKGIWGTPYYIAPEKLRGHESDARSDIYSLGGTLFHGLTLKPPFDGETPMDVIKARLKAPAPLVRTLRPDLSPEVEAIVARMLEADPIRRYPNYASVLSDIRRVLATLSPPPSTAHGQLSKKHGKIVMTKRKGSALAPVSPLASGLSSAMPPEVQDETVSALEPESPPEGKAKLNRRALRIVLWIAVGVIGVGGLIGGVVAFKKTQSREKASKQEHNKVAKFRKEADRIWSDLQTFRQEISNRVTVAEGMSSNIAGVVAQIAASMAQGAATDELTEASTNAAGLLAVVAQYSSMLGSAQVELAELAQQAGSNRLVMLTLTNSGAAEACWGTLTNVPSRTEALVTPINDGARNASKAVENVAALRKKFEQALKAVAEKAEQVAAEKAAAEKAAAERSAAEQVAAEKTARIQAELKTLEAARAAASAIVQQQQFKQALETVEQAARGLRTDEGRAAGKHAVKAYQLLAELKTLIVAGIKAEVSANPDSGYAFGWMGVKDIIRATDEKVVIRGEQVVPWTEMPPRQMIRFIQRYVDNNPDLTRREKAEYEFAVALYLHEAKIGDEKARGKEITRYVTNAIRGNSSLEEIARSVLPGVEIK